MELSLLQAAEKIALAIATMHKVGEGALEQVARKVEKTAKASLGEYQDAIGPFPEWAELAQATKDDRARQGFPEDEPLLRTGELRKGYDHETRGMTTRIGSPSEIAEYHEFGTAKMPPRPVLGPAVEHNKDFIIKTIGHAVTKGIVDGGQVHSALGYDNEF